MANNALRPESEINGSGTKTEDNNKEEVVSTG